MRFRSTWVEISKAAFTTNLRTLKKIAGKKSRLMAVLKADAYGHGALTLAPVALRSGAGSLGVSTVEEGLELRQHGITAPILLFGVAYSAGLDAAVNAHLTPTAVNWETLRPFKKIAGKKGAPVGFHLKVDTGMGRLGFSLQDAGRALSWVSQESGLHVEGIYSHLSSADSDDRFTRRQLERFQNLRKMAGALGFSDATFHLANSAGALRYKESHHDLIRPGLSLYGVSSTRRATSTRLSPVLSWHTAVIFLKKVPSGTPISYDHTFVTKKSSVIATLPVGYADGIPRRASNKGFVLIKGKRRPIVGRVTMDHIMVDVTGVPVSLGEKVTLIGGEGKASITALDWAEWADTNPYEILCGISKRVPRIAE